MSEPEIDYVKLAKELQRLVNENGNLQSRLNLLNKEGCEINNQITKNKKERVALQEQIQDLLGVS